MNNLKLSEEELEIQKRNIENKLEKEIKTINQSLYENIKIKDILSTNDRIYLFCGLIIANLKCNNSSLEQDDLKGIINDNEHDGIIILNYVKNVLESKQYSKEKINMIIGLLNSTFTKQVLWETNEKKSLINILFEKIKKDIMPCFDKNLQIDYIGKILNSSNDWTSIENDPMNDVVLTPRYITTLMVKLARTDKNSFVWDKTMGSGSFLISAMNVMIENAKRSITDKNELETKLKSIKEKQLLGIEILESIYILAIVNMLLLENNTLNIIKDDSHNYKLQDDFPANVFLLNPPYSENGKGFIFVEEAFSQMHSGYGVILIQDSVGKGQGLPYTKNVLEYNTLIASIKMPNELFGNKASVSTYIFVFKIAQKHNVKNLVKFIDFSVDGYARQNKKKSTQEINLKNVDHAIERYEELVSIVLDKETITNYYTKENGCFIEDNISLNGDDWLFSQHQKIDTIPKKEDFSKMVTNYLNWEISNLSRG